MFKVPEWGDDVPKINANFQKTNLKKEKKQKAPVAQESLAKVNANGINKKQIAKKATDKRKLKKRRQKNREIYQKLSNTQNTVAEIHSNNEQPGRFVLNPNKLGATENEKVRKIKPKRPQKQNIRKQKTNIPKGTNQEIRKPNKRKLNPEKDSDIDNAEPQILDMDKDMLIPNAKKKKLEDAFQDEDKEEAQKLFSEKPRSNSRKKERLKMILEKHNSIRNPVKASGNSLRERMLAKLQAAQFRYLNEKLYTSTGTEAKELFQADPAAFETYHQGYQQQIKKWPVNPLDVIVKRIMKMPKTATIADMGCGSAALAKRVPHKVRSFDLVASAPGVEACDMAHTPLLSGSADAAVYCLALMGTELGAYLAEGNRVLKTGGHLLIAEVESRFDSVEEFARGVEKLGFKLLKADQSHQVFHFLEFRKTQEAPKKAKHLVLTLKPCLYKRR